MIEAFLVRSDAAYWISHRSRCQLLNGSVMGDGWISYCFQLGFPLTQAGIFARMSSHARHAPAPTSYDMQKEGHHLGTPAFVTMPVPLEKGVHRL